MEGCTFQREEFVTVNDAQLSATLAVPENVRGAVLLFDGRASSPHGSETRYLARIFQKSNFATLLLDLMTIGERLRVRSGHLQVNLEFLTNRLIAATEWVGNHPSILGLPVGYFARGTGTAAALIAAGRLPQTVHALVSFSGRPDLAGDSLAAVSCPTLLIVSGSDRQVVSLNFNAINQLKMINKRLQVILSAGDALEESEWLEQVGASACDWFDRYLLNARNSGPSICSLSATGTEAVASWQI